MTTVQDQIAVPGQLLGPASRFVPGAGTHLADGQVYASLLGHVSVRQPAEAGKKTAVLPKRLTRIMVPSAAALAKGPDGAASMASMASSLADANKSTVSVSRARIAQGGEVLPDVGNTALCRVVRISQRQAVVAILVVGDVVLEAEWQGVIRAQDVRATEKDRIKIYESFRPGDIVRAQVISLGDQANYYLSTASNSLGVVMATSEAGNPMYPVSWKEYVDPETGLSEPRKVARPF